MTDPVRVAVAGAGLLGHRHARVFHEIEGATLVGVADPSLEKARAVADPYGAQAFTRLDALLETVECDAMAVATPDHLHTEPVLTALGAGKSVLVEKPLATSLADARAMIAEAAGRGVILQVNYSQRYVPEYAWIKEQIERGVIGRPSMIVSTKHDQRFVPTRMIRWAASTSPIFFMSSHDIDLVTWFLGATARRVVAHERHGTLSALGVDVHDGVDALVTYEGDVVASFHSSWILPDSYPTLTVERMTVMGDEGSLHFESRGRQVECYAGGGGRTIAFTGPQTATEIDGRIHGAFQESLLRFLDAVRTGTEPDTSAVRTFHVLEIQDAILEAARAGATVEIGARPALIAGP